MFGVRHDCVRLYSKNSKGLTRQFRISLFNKLTIDDIIYQSYLSNSSKIEFQICTNYSFHASHKIIIKKPFSLEPSHYARLIESKGFALFSSCLSYLYSLLKNEEEDNL